jgi:hypothetical protein
MRFDRCRGKVDAHALARAKVDRRPRNVESVESTVSGDSVVPASSFANVDFEMEMRGTDTARTRRPPMDSNPVP